MREKGVLRGKEVLIKMVKERESGICARETGPWNWISPAARFVADAIVLFSRGVSVEQSYGFCCIMEK